MAMDESDYRPMVLIGLAILASIPILNLATPLFGMAFMVHMHKKLTRQDLMARR